MTEIPQEGDLGALQVLKDFAYVDAEEVFYAAQAIGPELTELVGIAPVELQMRLAPMLNLLPQAVADSLVAEEYELGVPSDLSPPPLSPITAPVPAAPPPNVNHIPDMPPVRHQQNRGTCVAHASVAVVEHYLNTIGAAADLSEQFLYWDCKQNDGIPNKPGTWVRVAFPLIDRDGVCPEADWPYVPNPTVPEGGGPPPGMAIVNALPYRQRVRAVPQRSITDIKAELARGRCVAFSVPVFRSWFRSAWVRATGKINMPLPNDIVEGGHAMTFVGYADSTETGTGGGRFILRNSWGPTWAAQSQHAPGYGTIPYAYIQRHCNEAYTLA